MFIISLCNFIKIINTKQILINLFYRWEGGYGYIVLDDPVWMNGNKSSYNRHKNNNEN